ncbi:hypothetical protein [Clostridium sp. UBA1652]|uniref:hypothetical protein n=1 Tax=Clostridium sp. UBA1652 TaxID=1946348 RepID=UPI002580B2D2|nr:hypothetical protein [Clostridium sp. UBA1652]
MKNTKLLIATIITALTLSIVGCNKEKPKDALENTTESQEVVSEESTETTQDVKEETPKENNETQENNVVQEDNTKVQTANAPTEVKPKNNSDNQTNKNTSKAKEINNTPKVEKPNTPQAPANPPKAEDSTPVVYTNNNFGFSLTFPASWKDKYTVTEDGNGIYVAVKSPNSDNIYYGLLFAILKKGSGLNEDYFDTIPNGKRYFEAKGISYVIGSTTGIPIPEDDPSYELWRKMYRESGAVTKTLKAL